MRKSRITIPWEEGLHMRPAAEIVKCAKAFKSTIYLKINDRLADARSILAIMILAASFGSAIDIEVMGADEREAHEAITAIFDTSNGDGSGAGADGGCNNGAYENPT